MNKRACWNCNRTEDQTVLGLFDDRANMLGPGPHYACRDVLGCCIAAGQPIESWLLR